MPLAGFEPTIPVFKRAKTFHALDRAATATGIICTHELIMWGFREGNAYEVFSEDLKERDHLEDLG
jgi:hypothetical protein